MIYINLRDSNLVFIPVVVPKEDESTFMDLADGMNDDHGAIRWLRVINGVVCEVGYEKQVEEFMAYVLKVMVGDEKE